MRQNKLANSLSVGEPKREIFIQHCLRLVDENQWTYNEMIAETKTMLAGVSKKQKNCSL